MIFSARRKSAKELAPTAKTHTVLVESKDSAFAEKIGRTLEQWGFHHLLRGGDGEQEQHADEVDVGLLDIRALTDDAFGHVYSIRQQYEGAEVILINRAGNVAASIAGMKAGAVDEIIVPFDTGTLQALINEACQRVRLSRAKRRKRPSLLARFSEAMMAATFAQAGDFDGALDLLDTPAAKQNVKQGNKKK